VKSLIATLAAVMIAASASAQTARGAVAPPVQQGRPPLTTRPAGDAAIIRTVADALGFVRGLGRGETTDTLNRLQWLGTGTMSVNGQVRAITKYSYALTLNLTGAREDIQFKSTAGMEDRRVRAFLGSDAWNEKAPGEGLSAAPADISERRLQFFRTPFGFAKALLKADRATVKVTDPGASSAVTIAMSVDGTPIVATLDFDYRPAIITTDANGRKTTVTYSRYRDLAEYGMMFPTRIVETVDGRPSMTLTIDGGRVSSYLILQPPSSTTK